MQAAKKSNLTSMTKANISEEAFAAAAAVCRKLREQETERWEKAEKSWTITSRDAAQRVRVLREELENCRDRSRAFTSTYPAMVYPIHLIAGTERTSSSCSRG